MVVSLRERLVAGSLPPVSFMLSYTYFWLIPPLVIAAFLASHRLGYAHTRRTLIKVMDLWFSIFVYAIVAGLLAAAVGLAVQDAQADIPLLSETVLQSLILLVMTVLTVAALLALSIAGFRGRDITIPGLIRPCEFWSGRGQRLAESRKPGGEAGFVDSK